MDCKRCHQPLEPGARFCRNCGLPVAEEVPDNAVPSPTNQADWGSSPQPPWTPPKRPTQPRTPSVSPSQQQSAQNSTDPWPSPQQQQPAPDEAWPPPQQAGAAPHWAQTAQQQDAQQPARDPWLPTQPSAPAPQPWQVQQPSSSAPWDATQVVPPAQQGRSPAQPVSPPAYSNVSQVPSPSPMTYFQSNTNTGAKMPPAAVKTEPGRRRRGCVVGCLSTFLLLLLLLGLGWVFFLRPYLHDQVVSRIDDKMSTAIKNLPPLPTQLLAGHKLPVPETLLNNLLALNVAPSDPVQHPLLTITKSTMRFEFQAFGFQCAITGAPALRNGQLIATNVGVEGIVGLIMSPEEVTALIDKELKAVQTRLNQSVQDVSLQDHELDLTLSGNSGSGGGTPITIPTTIPTALPTLPKLP